MSAMDKCKAGLKEEAITQLPHSWVYRVKLTLTLHLIRLPTLSSSGNKDTNGTQVILALKSKETFPHFTVCIVSNT